MKINNMQDGINYEKILLFNINVKEYVYGWYFEVRNLRFLNKNNILISSAIYFQEKFCYFGT